MESGRPAAGFTMSKSAAWLLLAFHHPELRSIDGAKEILIGTGKSTHCLGVSLPRLIHGQRLLCATVATYESSLTIQFNLQIALIYYSTFQHYSTYPWLQAPSQGACPPQGWKEHFLRVQPLGQHWPTERNIRDWKMLFRLIDSQRKVKGKEEYLYSAFYILCISQSAQAWITQFYLQIHHACLAFVSVHQMTPPLTEVRDIQLQVTTQLSTPNKWKTELAWLVDL